MANSKNIVGPQGQLYAELQPGSDESAFKTDNTSAAYYNSPYYLQHQSEVQPIPPPRAGAALQIQLQDYVDAGVLKGINSAGEMVFHAVGDTGAAKVNKAQTAATAIAHEASVADAMAAEVRAGGPNPPAFFFHLGDVVYNFGEGKYYYDQFYEPYRAYDRPIFGLAGNHDGMVFGDSPDVPQTPTLFAFLRNFCSDAPGPSPDGGGLVRSVMTQPGVYFTLETPVASIIAIYSNVLDGPGVMSSQGGHFPISDEQLDFLTSELTRLKPDRNGGKGGVILAVHHPPVSADSKHGGSTGLSDDIDACCKKAGLWPDLVLSGHAHLYQRFTRRVSGGKQIPYIVCGAGGFATTPPQSKLPSAPFTIGDHTLEVDPIVQFGYLALTTSPKQIKAVFRCPTVYRVEQADAMTLDLTTGTITQGASPVESSSGTRYPAKPGKKSHKSSGHSTAHATKKSGS